MEVGILSALEANLKLFLRKRVFFNRGDGPRERQKIHAPGTVKFQEAGGFIRGRAGGQDIV